MKYIVAIIFALLIFSCQKDDINSKSFPQELESISGSVFFKKETGPFAPIQVILRRLSVAHELDTLNPLLDTIATTFTDENGHYVFDQIIPSDDSFAIQIVQPNTHRILKSMDETIDGDFLETLSPIFKNSYYIGVQLNSEEHDDGNNFYISNLNNKGKVSGFLYTVNDNVTKPLVNATVWITDRNDQGGVGGQVYGQANSNAEGYYEIELSQNIKGIIHTHLGVGFPIPLQFLEGRKSLDETPDDDPTSLDDISIPVDIVDCEEDDQNNFYFYIKHAHSISGKVIKDVDNDGSGDVAVANQRVELYQRNNNVPLGPLAQATNSKSDGSFSFEYLIEGEYILYFIGSGEYDVIAGYDQDQEPGEPSNTKPQFINVNLPIAYLEDSLNNFILKDRECDQNLRLVEYWALCDTNIVCSLTKDIPIICVDENNKPVTQLTGNKFLWRNLVTGATSQSDVVFWNLFEPIKLTINLTDGCSYDLFYNRDCAKDLHGGNLHLKTIQGGFQPNFDYQNGEVVWRFDVFNATLQINHNITSPISSNLVPAGNYTYQLTKTSNNKYTMNIQSESTNITYTLGEIGYNNGSITFDNGLIVDGIKRTFVKQ